ncbi:MAG: fused MFS/spermidine synthase [Planctomycetia bacterium]|nr:fused MFS/spermidine synthase [Planctomycetia bacterium]
MVNLYRVTAFLSAALLFVAQPLFARLVLPLVGGAPAVWNTCQVFFQVALLAGYLYAHASTQWLGPRRQAALHILLILIPFVCLPFTLVNASPPNPEVNPSPWLLALMVTTIGPPFLALSATAPLVQRWFASAQLNAARDPYSLYVMSNIGSFVALLGYPFLIEPAATLRTQTIGWAIGYGIWIACLAACATYVWRAKNESTDAAPVTLPEVIPPTSAKRKSKKHAPAPAESVAVFVPDQGEITWRRRLHWLALSGVPVAWMLGVTTWITTDIAPIPLLWIVPLALYLVTYILAFSQRGGQFTAWARRIHPWAMCALVASLTGTGVWQLMLPHVLAFAVGVMVCHGQLAQLRPSEKHLTEFYVWLSVGGALGGTFIALVAPLVFVVPWEYALAVTAGCALAPRPSERANRLVDLVCVFAVLILLLTLRQYVPNSQKPLLLMGALLGFPALAWFHNQRRPWAFALVMGLILALDIGEVVGGLRTLRTARSYFGVHLVSSDIDEFGRTVHTLQHGTTAHGMQIMNEGFDCTPLVYYYPTGPLGDVFGAFTPKEGEQQHFAAVGLGTGAAACYVLQQRDVTFFEIDPTVRELAENPEYFTYLSKCAKGRYQIKLGDGRRMLAQEPAGRYDVILLDAFSSDAIPVHLLTREALAIYMSRLTPDGVVVFHISNNHLDLAPVLADLAHESGWVFRIRRHDPPPADQRNYVASSTYVVIARQVEHLRTIAEDPRWRPQRPSGRAVWTDDYSNVLSVLR